MLLLVLLLLAFSFLTSTARVHERSLRRAPESLSDACAPALPRQDDSQALAHLLHSVGVMLRPRLANP